MSATAMGTGVAAPRSHRQPRHARQHCMLSHVVEAAGVEHPLDLRHDGGLELPLDERVEVEVLEPRVLLDLCGAAVDHSESLRRLVLEELLDERHGLLAEVGGEIHGAVHDLRVRLHGVLVVERLAEKRKREREKEREAGDEPERWIRHTHQSPQPQQQSSAQLSHRRAPFVQMSARTG